MNKETILIVLFIAVLSTSRVYGQSNSKAHNASVEFGLGTAFLGTGDEWIGKGGIFLKHELGKGFINDVSFNFGHVNRDRTIRISNPGGYSLEGSFSFETIIMTTFHIDHNLMFSPRAVTKKFNIYIGTGYSIMYISDVHRQNVYTPLESTSIERRTSVGFNFLIEPTYVFKNRNIISIRIISQNYLNADISNGALIKFGRIIQ